MFLDVDGVLNNDIFLDTVSHPDDMTEWWINRINPQSVIILNDITDAINAEIVISSSWRVSMSNEKLIEVFKRAGIKAKIIGHTPYLRELRGIEIKKWMESHPNIELVVILDDVDDMGTLSKFLVKTDPNIGLTQSHLNYILSNIYKFQIDKF